MRSSRILILLLLTLWTLAAGGCALPRAVAMKSWLENEIPIPPGGQRLPQRDQVYANNLDGSHPTAYAAVESPLSPQETFDWLQQALTQRGWAPEYPTYFLDPRASDRSQPPSWDPPKPTSATNPAVLSHEYFAVRERCGSPQGWPILREHLDISINNVAVLKEGTPGCQFEFRLSTDYVWDQPTQWIEYALFFPTDHLLPPDPALIVRYFFAPVLVWF